ncbi:Phosphatidylcholine-sterol acyltransferase [Smittium mucronatum]|uniref:Phosphatidylcholine-sterol acyltransferase n=1 Tax=Smittium mucronatum TaxID=133383 RepID=A0A1R0GSW9_9FUNG|nr:Phosphatidylcholine-sterol acyltransferase [Smittium mucronatum]
MHDSILEGVSNMVVFGDDNVDLGRSFLENDGIYPDPKIYYYGRFTNGLTWAEKLANDKGISMISYGFGMLILFFSFNPIPFTF